MDKQTIDRFQKKTARIVEESFRVLREGFREAGRLIHATADATKLHIEKESRVIVTHREFHRLGEEVYRAVKGDHSADQCKINETMRDIIRRIESAEDEISRSNELLKHLTIVDSQKGATQSEGETQKDEAEAQDEGGAARVKRRERVAKRSHRRKSS